MKLLSLTNRYHFVSIFIVLSIGGVVGFYILKNIVNHEFNEKLYADRDQFLFEWHTYENVKEVLYLNIGDRINVIPSSRNIRYASLLRDTLMWDDYEKRELPFRQLVFSDQLNGKSYDITITKSLLPNEDLIKGVGEIILLLMVGIILSLVIINRQISKKLWSPFYDTISHLDQFKISVPTNIEFTDTNIFEFKELNDVIKKMFDKSQRDYRSLKEFTENASHEIQTPLAIIKSKAEILLQDSKLSEDDLEEIVKISEAASRLSKLKTELVMLAKMDNNQFEDAEAIDLVSFIKDKLVLAEELIEMKKIKLEINVEAEPTLILNNTLAYVLINNLINNAIKHNVKNGTISITISDDTLAIENTGKPLDHDPDVYFQRFKKGSSSAESSGLGLALIKKVCDLYDMKIQYKVQDSKHRMEVHF